MIEWDESKNSANREKHGLAFEDVHLVFEGPTVTFLDDRRDYGEVRYITMGSLPVAPWWSSMRREAKPHASSR
jgi:hypothetical protein